MIQKYQIDFPEFSSDENLQALVNLPLNLQIIKRINEIGRMSIEYPLSADEELFSGSSQLKLPKEVSIKVEHGEGSETKEACLFRGFLDAYQISSSPSQGQTRVGFVDPLITTKETDEPTQWQEKSLKAIVDHLFQNAYESRSSSRNLSSKFEGGEPPKPVYLTNLGKTDFEFLREEVFEKFGYCFYFNSLNEDKDEVVFFKLNEAPGDEIEIDAATLKQNSFEFSSSIHQFPSEIHVHDSENEAEIKKVDDFESGFSEHFKLKAKIRKDNGINLTSHHYYPNEKKDFCADFAESTFLSSAFTGDQLTFSSDKLLNPGDCIKISDTEGLVSKGVLGKYLVVESQHSTTDTSHWLNTYIGVRA